MSHVVSIKTELRDLAAIRAAFEELGCTFKEGQKTFQWYGQHVGDYPLPTGFRKEDMGHCDHAVAVPGTSWEIGIARARNPDGTPRDGFTLLFDFYGSQGLPLLKVVGGESAAKLVQLYGVHKATLEAKRRGLLVKRQAGKNGSIQVVCTGF